MGERFCPACGMPLTYAGRREEGPRTDAHGRARKIDPRYLGGELVQVATGRNQAEAELLQSLLLEHGIPSVLRRTAGFDVPDFLAAGPRDVMVSEAGLEAARETLGQMETGEPPTEGSTVSRSVRVGGGILVALLAGSTLLGGVIVLVRMFLG